MLTTLPQSAVKDCSLNPTDHVCIDCNTLSELIFAIAPEAKVIPEGSVNIFYLMNQWAFALIPHQHNLSLYHASDIELSQFHERLHNVHLGDHCLIIDNLDVVNLNVLVELLAVLKVDMQRKHQLDQALH